jgi:riboflavin synthase
MFTGIVEGTGKLKRITHKRGISTFEIDLGSMRKGLKKGHSVCCQGVCLTAVRFSGNRMSVEVMKETLDCTNLGQLRVGDKINIERSLKLSSSLGGHFVFGHVDGQARLLSVKDEGDSKRYRFKVPVKLMRFITRKGSVSLNGVSLTVAAAGRGYFEICLIPHTLKATTLGTMKTGETGNVEIDMLARYSYKLLTGKEVDLGA